MMNAYINLHIMIAMTVEDLLRWLKKLGRKLGQWPRRRDPTFG